MLFNIEVGSFEDRAYGCLLGAFCGDALGSFLEFTTYNSDQVMDECMLMPGGGPFNLGSGQITDDSELALCLMQGLINSD